MSIFRNVIKNTKLYKKCLVTSQKNFYRPISIGTVHYTRNKRSVDLAYNTYENVNTTNDLPPLIIMHGLFGSKQNWRSICKAILQKTVKRKIIVVDARNHGESPHTPEHRYEDMTEDIVQVLRKENIKRVSVLGHSMGGRCMMYMALKYPHLVEKAIFLDISPVSSSPSLTSMGLIFNAMNNVSVSNKLEMADARKQADYQLKQLNIQDKQLRDFVLTNFIQHSDSRYGWRINVEALNKSFISHIAQFPRDAVNLKYPGPVLFIGGANSDYISENHLPEIRKIYFPTAQLIMLPNAGHLVHVDQPAVLIDLIISFLSATQDKNINLENN